MKNTARQDTPKDDMGDRFPQRGDRTKENQAAVLAGSYIQCHQLNNTCITTFGTTSHNKEEGESKLKSRILQ